MSEQMKCALYMRVANKEQLGGGAMTIKEIRSSTGLSQAKFCEALGIPLRTLQKWEIGEHSCPEYVVELIAYRVQHDPKFSVN